LIYHLQTKWRDDPRPRSGLIRVREFTMKDSYSLDANWEGLERQYRAHYQAYFNIFNRCGLPSIAVKSDTGMMGGKVAHEYMYLNPIGEDTLILCDACGYAANRQVARFAKPAAKAEEILPVEKVATPDTKTIEDLAKLLGIAKSQTAKAVFLMARQEDESEKLVMAIVRGDMEVNETKLGNAVKAKALRPARDEEIRPSGAVPGYASPIGVKGAVVLVDEAVASSPNLVAGANEEGFHLKNVNCGRDYQAEQVLDLAAAQEGDACPECGAGLRASRGVEVGNIFQLGTRYTDAMNCTFLDAEGKARPVIMGSYGIGVGRLLACIAEEHRDEQGLIWPISVAPYQVHLVSLAKGAGQAGEATDQLYAQLQEAGFEVLLDDRPENPGVKFNDADLIGIPLRLTVGERSLKKGAVELRIRGQQENSEVPVGEVVARIKAEVAALCAALQQRVVEVPFKD
jgi:prolyl-tRNA synthetase